MSVSPACWPCKLCWNWGLSSAPVKYEAGSNRESIQWMFTVRLEGRGESENRGGSISSCCLPPALLTPKNAARKPNFPFLNLRSCWRCSVRQYAGKGTGWIVTALLGNQHTLKQRHYIWSRGVEVGRPEFKKWCFVAWTVIWQAGLRVSQPQHRPAVGGRNQGQLRHCNQRALLGLGLTLTLPVHSVQWRNMALYVA